MANFPEVWTPDMSEDRKWECPSCLAALDVGTVLEDNICPQCGCAFSVRDLDHVWLDLEDLDLDSEDET